MNLSSVGINSDIYASDSLCIYYKMGITKPCTHLHPGPSSSIHLPPALCNILNNIWTQILHVIGQFPQI